MVRISPSFTPNWLAGAPALMLWARRASSLSPLSCSSTSLTFMATIVQRLANENGDPAPGVIESRHEQARGGLEVVGPTARGPPLVRRDRRGTGDSRSAHAKPHRHR